jgi:hypothetical protein
MKMLFCVSSAAYVPRGNGNSTATAATLIPTINGTTAVVSEVGIISSSSSSDFFKIQANTGNLNVSIATLTPFSRYVRSNLDAAVTILDAAGSPVGPVMDLPGMAVNGSVFLPAAGTYYIAVSGAGNGTAYSKYASLGQFALTATFQAPPASTAVTGRR